jgi:enolase-phosphatase E1
MIKAVVTDIEGTTSSLSFVKDVLFPYARERLPHFVQARRHDPQVQKLLLDVGAAVNKPLNEENAIAQLIRWIDEDKKITPLKSLQGLIWEEGYRAHDFTGHVYADAVTALRSWHARGLRLYVYSSGSVKAQQLLFGHSDYGDLTPLFSGYFDTTIGGKKEAGSYHNIVEALGLPASEILFLSDISDELDAAKAAGLMTYWLVRDGSAGDVATHPLARDFGEIRFNS